MKIRRRFGFTLIEILVVIAIIGILASIIMFALNKAGASGRDAQRISDMKTIYGALELYYSDHGQYPSMNDVNVSSNWNALITTLQSGQYLTRAAQNEQSPHYAQSPLDKVLAFLSLAPVAYASSHTYQDPLYPRRSYGYMPSGSPSVDQNYRLRAQMENTSAAANNQSLSGQFLYTDEPTGSNACDPSLGYYCTGPASGYAAFEPGKPVIYLYPTATTDVSVFIHPLRIDVSVPSYENGWHVTASPDGTLINDGDGARYPYLYWEGGSTKPVVDTSKGFVIATKDIHSFLESSLAAQGLKGNEISDFIAYWQPRMTTTEPYVYVYFMPQPVYDKLVPMEIVPAPETLIRVYMLFKPLEAPLTVDPETFTAPKRVGFTAVEWGGDRTPLQ